MFSQKRRARPRFATALLAAAMTMSACAALPGLGGDDTAATETAAPAATETTLAQAAPAEATPEPAEAEPVDDGAAAAEEAAEAARAVGRTGPIRELPGLATWADMDLHPFLVEVMNMPVETPIPDGVVLTYVDVTQYMDEDASRLDFTATFLPMFEREEFVNLVPALLESTVWTASGVDEDLENASTRLSFSSDDPASPYSSITYMFEDATAERQAKLSIFTSARDIYGPELIINQALFPWMGDIEVEPTLIDDFASVNLGRLDDKAELDRRWKGPIGAFQVLSDFYAAPTSAGITPGVQEFDDFVWPSNETSITRAEDGFEGKFAVNETDPEREVSVLILGRYLLS